MIQIPNNDNDERGQVGIGTLIVFIALVLVAAIAAGVLINTAGFLQTQAEATGQESTSQVADNLDIESTIGDVVSSTDGDGNAYAEVQGVEVVVSQSPGSNNIDLTALTVEYLNPYGAETLVYTEGGTEGDSGGQYNLDRVNDDTEDYILSDSSDRYRIVLPLTEAQGSPAEPDHALQAGDEGELIITTSQGSQRTVTFTVPDSLNGDGDVRL